LKDRARELGISINEAVNLPDANVLVRAHDTDRCHANLTKGLAGVNYGREAMMADKEIEVFETTAGQVADALTRLGVPKDRMVTVMIEPATG
jgi:hypothetical protein